MEKLQQPNTPAKEAFWFWLPVYHLGSAIQTLNQNHFNRVLAEPARKNIVTSACVCYHNNVMSEPPSAPSGTSPRTAGVRTTYLCLANSSWSRAT